MSNPAPVFDAVVPDEVLADALGRYICEVRPELEGRLLRWEFVMTADGVRVTLYRPE